MDPARNHDSYLGHRAACDECSIRKIRCASDGGACRTCIARGAACTYSTKVPVGRPKKRRTTSTEPQSKPALLQRQSYRSDGSSSSGNSIKSSASSLYQPSLASSATSIDESNTLGSKSRHSPSRRASDDRSESLQWPTSQTQRLATGGRHDSPQLASDTLAEALQSRLQPLSQTRHASNKADLSQASRSRHQPPSPTKSHSRIASFPQSASILSFTALLGRVMSLRHELESVLNRSQHRRSLSDATSNRHSTSHDSLPGNEMYTAITQFYDLVEPYLSLQQSIVASMSTQKLYELQTMLCLVVNAAATVVEMVSNLTERYANERITDRGLSQHLSQMQTLSTLEYQIRRCERSLRITAEVLKVAQARSAHDSGRGLHGADIGGYCSSDIEPASVAALGRDALRLRTELARRIDLLKRPTLV